jgi:16S rRNA processing protein RimM
LRADAHGNGVLVAFAEIDSRKDAEALSGASLYVARSALPARGEGELYDFELTGALVVTRDGEELGRIEEIVVTGANDVYVARGPRGEVLVPATKHAVLDFDTERRMLVVDARALEFSDES